MELERRPAPPLTAATLVLGPARPVHPGPTDPWPVQPGSAEPGPAEPRPIQPFATFGDTTGDPPSETAKPSPTRALPFALIALPVILILITAAVVQVNRGSGRITTSTSVPSSAAAIGRGTDADRTSDNPTIAVGTGPQADYPCSGNAGSTGSDLLAIASPPPSGVQPYRTWWRNTEQVENLTFGERSWQATVRPGTVNLWDLLVVHSCLPVQTGRQYSLTFTASAGTPVTLRARVQDKSPPDYTASLSQDVLLGPGPQRWTLPFEGALTSAASELSFQIGGNPEAEIQVTDIALVDTGP